MSAPTPSCSPTPELDTVKGLGRHFSWEAFLKADDAQGKLFPEVLEIDCMCFDGEPDDE